MFTEVFAYVAYLCNLMLPIGMVVGPVCGYVPQYFLLKKTMSVGSFSPLVCYILIASMYARILYWYWNRFELPLLFQAIVMLITMCGILQVVMQITRETINEHNSMIIRSGNAILYYFIPSVTIFFLFNFIFRSDFITDVLGIVALVIEACLPVPQCYSNYERKSTRGLSMFMVYTWIAGDSFKTFYYAYRDVPTYFLVCGAFQLSIDLLILYQCVCGCGDKVVVAAGVHDSDDEEIQTVMKYGGGGSGRYVPVSVHDPDNSSLSGNAKVLARVNSGEGIAMVGGSASGLVSAKNGKSSYTPPATPPRQQYI